MSLNFAIKAFAGVFDTEQINNACVPGALVRLSRFAGSSMSLALSAMAGQGRRLVVVTPDGELARFLHSDLSALGVSPVLLYPPLAVPPYDKRQMRDTAVTAQRSEVIDQIRDGEARVLVTSAEAMYEKIASPVHLAGATLKLQRGGTQNPDSLMRALAEQHYESVSFVNEPGEFARRGGIIDIFPFAGEYPVRLEFFGDEIESIREFDADSQRSVAFLDHIRLVPNLEALSRGNREHLLSFFDEDTIVALVDYTSVMAESARCFQKAEELFTDASGSEEPPQERYTPVLELEQLLAPHPLLVFGSAPGNRTPDLEFSIEASPQPDFNSSVKILRQEIKRLSLMNTETLILCDNEGQQSRFEELLGDTSPTMRYRLCVETLHKGFVLPQADVAVFTDHQIFNRYHRPRTRTRSRRGGISFKELKDLNIGDFVVHVDHGIGRFAGFRKITVRGAEQESVMLRYKDDSILYVNVSSLHKLQKYAGKDGAPASVTKLGSGEWARKKAKTRKRVKDIARDLIVLYAKRKAQKAWAYSADSAMQTELEASFMYEETPDQAQAITDVKKDMMADIPMDRLVCGDVGFGKTEVAVRAAFKAVLDGKQVAVMVPTTILADQHWKTFRERMKDTAVQIEAISRFRSKAEQTDILRRAREGKIDILIGTHRIASKDVAFRDLGLLIIDEEQRFGVSIKERLKEFRASVDVLTLTATPIPRTLQFALMGARDLSVINTPPPNRQPVLTEIHSYDPRLVRDAIMQEVSRGGQVFFIHNRVENIEQIASMVRSLLPDIRVKFAHGQMSGRELEKIIMDFYDHKFDVLISTNIVENGIDISNANTIIINQANHFGLSELHQLRGRVGRSNRKAYCYLITPPMESLTLESRRRLMALEEFSDLGSGFHIAMRDLDIRGAGDILGAEQSGFINEVGFEMYNKILNEAVRELKQEEFSDLFKEEVFELERPETTVEYDLSALLPADYVHDNVERLNLYRRLSGVRDEQEITDWQEEVADRFGPLPEAARNLVLASRIRTLASRLWLSKVTIRSQRMWLQCPDHGTEAGTRFYDQGGLQHMMTQLEALRDNRFQLVQKDQAVRFAIQDVVDAQAALELLRQLQPASVNGNGSKSASTGSGNGTVPDSSTSSHANGLTHTLSTPAKNA